MNCFKHRTEPAVGICKSCGKGLCAFCGAEVEHGLACRDSCEERVELINRIVDLSGRNLVVANRQMRLAAVFIFCIGFVLLAIAATVYSEDSRFMTMFLGSMGALMLAYGTMRLFSKGFSNPHSQTPLEQKN